MKELLVKDEGIVLMDLEMVMERFKGMIYQFAHQCENEFKKYEYNVDSFEDYCQIGKIELVKAYDGYKIENGICFSTYVATFLQNCFCMMYRKLNAKKRAVKNTISLNKELETTTTIEELIPTKKDKYFKIKEESLEQFIKDNMTKEEIIFLLMDIKKLTTNPSKILISSSSYALDVLGEEVDINVKKLTRTELANSLGITRPTLNARIKKSVKKAQQLTETYFNNKV